MSDKVIGWLLVIFFTPLLAFSIYAVFFIVPVLMYTEAECLRNGYPKSSVTVGLERYCMNLQGTVTVRVDKVSK